MSHIQSNAQLGVTVPDFPIPSSQAEFDKLTMTQRGVLFEQYPATYQKYARPKEHKPWEK